MDIDKSTIPEVAPTFRVQWEEVQDCYVVLYPEGMVKLSNSAGEIMKRVDGQTSIEAIIKNLEQADIAEALDIPVQHQGLARRRPHAHPRAA